VHPVCFDRRIMQIWSFCSVKDRVGAREYPRWLTSVISEVLWGAMVTGEAQRHYRLSSGRSSQLRYLPSQTFCGCEVNA
jgi:hypothetical protein